MRRTVTKGELVEAIASGALGRSRAEVEAIIDRFILLTQEMIRAGYRVEVRGLGTFTARPSGEEGEFAPAKRVVFYPGKAMRRAAAEAPDVLPGPGFRDQEGPRGPRGG